MDHEKINFSEIMRIYSITLIMVLLRIIATAFLPGTSVPDTDLSEYIYSLTLFSQNL